MKKAGAKRAQAKVDLTDIEGASSCSGAPCRYPAQRRNQSRSGLSINSLLQGQLIHLQLLGATIQGELC